MTHLLDTNACIAAMRGQPALLLQLQRYIPTDLAVSTVSLSELYSGVERCQNPAQERRKIEILLHPLHLLPFDAAAAQQTAHLRYLLERQGQLIGPYDLMLAGQALSLDLTFVTHNTREFSRVPNLRFEDWQ